MNDAEKNELIIELKMKISAITAGKPAAAVVIALCELIIHLTQQATRMSRFRGFRDVLLEMLADTSEQIRKIR